MTSARVIRHQCDRCHKEVEVADNIRAPNALPEGWQRFREWLLCSYCGDRLRHFVESNEAAEQAR